MYIVHCILLSLSSIRRRGKGGRGEGEEGRGGEGREGLNPFPLSELFYLLRVSANVDLYSEEVILKCHHR